VGQHGLHHDVPLARAFDKLTEKTKQALSNVTPERQKYTSRRCIGVVIRILTLARAALVIHPMAACVCGDERDKLGTSGHPGVPVAFSLQDRYLIKLATSYLLGQRLARACDCSSFETHDELLERISP